MKNLKKVLFLAVFALGLICTGCGIKTNNASTEVKPEITDIGDRNGWFYSSDKNTGVMYLNYNGVKRYATSVMLDVDGTTITVDKLGISIYNEDTVSPSILKTGDNIGYNYVVDKNTGVVYLFYNGAERCSLSVMLNADGTPITAEELEIEY